MNRAKFGEDVEETTNKNADDFLHRPHGQVGINASSVEGYSLDKLTTQTVMATVKEFVTTPESKTVFTDSDQDTNFRSFAKTSANVMVSEPSVPLGYQNANTDVTTSQHFHFISPEDITTQSEYKDTTEILNVPETKGDKFTTTLVNDRVVSTSKLVDFLSTTSFSDSSTTSQSVLQSETTYEGMSINTTTSSGTSLVDHISRQTTFASDMYSNVTERLSPGHQFNWSDISTGPYDVNSSFLSQNITNVSGTTSFSFSFDFDPYFALTSSKPVSPDVAATGVEDVTWDVVMKIIVLAIISLVGSFGNVIVIWSIVKERHLHRPPFYFLLSLGVTDLSRAVFCVPVVVTTVLNGSRWKHGESACKLFAFATSFFVFSSALSLLAIAIDRHVSIVYSKTYRRRSLGIANLVVAILIWVISFSVSFPPVVGVGDYVFIPDEAQCAYQHKHYTHNDSVASVLVFLAILFLTYFLYFRIFRYLRAHRRMRPLQHTPARSANWAFVGPGANGQAFINWLNGFGGQAPIRQGGQRAVQRLNFGRVVNLSTAKNEHLTRLFLVLTMIFGIMWSPYVVLSLWRIFCDASVLPSAYVTVAAWLGYGQVAVCPIVYLVARGPARNPTRTVYSHAEKREFLLENKIAK